MITNSVVHPSSKQQTQKPGCLAERGLEHGPYGVRLASAPSDIADAQRLRFQVFNLELKEGLESAFTFGLDTDEFDMVCDHLIVEHHPTKRVVGTYRLQTGTAANRHLGYYSEREFDFSPYETLRPKLVELGRACIHREHRSTQVLYLLWRGIVEYSIVNHGRYLIGCSSLTSQDPAQGHAVYRRLREWLVEEALRTSPRTGVSLPILESTQADDSVPKLLRTYLAIGARICGPPAMDREFKTIDFLTLLDLENLHARIRMRLFGC